MTFHLNHWHSYVNDTAPTNSRRGKLRTQHSTTTLFYIHLRPSSESSMLCHTPYKMGLYIHSFTTVHQIIIISKPKLSLSLCRANTENSQVLRADPVAGISGQTIKTCTTSVEVGEERAAAQLPLSTSLQRPISRRAWIRPRLSRRSLHLRVPQH